MTPKSRARQTEAFVRHAGFAALIGYEADKRGRSWALYAGFTLVGTPILSLILLAIDAGNRPRKS